MAIPPADDLQRRMAQIRENLHRDAGELADDVRKLTDWRYHVQRHPWVCVALSAAVGYLAVPRKKPEFRPDLKTLKQLARHQQLVIRPEQDGAKSGGMAASLVSMAAAALLRTGMAYAGQHLGRVWENRSAGAAAPSHNGHEASAENRKPR